MKAIAKSRPEPGLEIVEVEEPQCRPGCVKLRVEHGSVCGTDLHIYNWDAWAQNRIQPPRIVGHEFCGTVVEVGSGVTKVKVGDFVASESHIIDPASPVYLAGNGHVDPTTTILGVDVDGGFSPYAVVPELNARPVPPGVPHNVASMMDALGNAVHTVMDGPVEGQTVLITGLGPIGMFAVAVCKALGAAKIVATEVSPYRIELGLKAGADVVINPREEFADEKISKMFPGGVDATLEMSGHPTSLDLAIRMTRAEGRVSLLGVYADVLRMVDFNQIVFKGLRLHGIVGRRMWDTWDQMTWLLTEKNLDVNAVITHHVPWQDFDGAMRQMKSGEAGKIVLDFSAE